MTQASQNSAIRTAWRNYLPRYRDERWKVAGSCLLAVLQFALIVPNLLLIRMMFDRAIPQGDVKLLVLLGSAMAGLNLLNGGVSLLVRRVSLAVNKRVIRNLRAALLAKLYTVSRSYWSTSDHALLQTRIVQDSERVDTMSNGLISEALPAVICAAAVSLVLLWLNWQLYLSLLVLVPLFYVVNRWLSPEVTRRVIKFRQSFEGFSRGVTFVLSTIDLTRIQSAEQYELERQSKRLDDLRDSSGRMAWLESAYRIAQQNITIMGTLVVLVFGGAQVADGRMSLGGLMSFYLAFGLLNSYFRTLLSSVPEMINGTHSLVALDQILQVEDVEPYQGGRRIVFQGGLSLRGVRFRYTDADILRGVDLEIEPGSKVALAGANGSGKTTLLYLLCGFYRPDDGTVLADGVAYDEIDIRALRESFAFVMQDPVLFSGSIFDNIAYGNPAATGDQVREAAQISTAHQFISELPQGYETPVGDDGVLLSGGQRQKIAIARALLRRPRVLILDEPTNHLDAAAIRQLTANLRNLDHHPTLLVVSHQPDILRELDMVLEMHDGKVVERAMISGKEAPGR
jgi:ABC-type bacteriocin/lantibiotic exporter with double-glycine peptidase domain